MALSTKRAKKAAKKGRKDAAKTASKVQDQAQKTAADLGSTAEDKAGKAVEELKSLAENAGDKASQFVDQVRPQVEEGLRTQGEKISAFGEKIGPQAEKLRNDLQDDYLPRARRTAEATGSVVSSAVAAAVDAARSEFDKGQGDIKKAAVAAPKKKSGRAGKVLLVLGLAAVGAAAGYLVWKKTRPVEDPWAPPADFARAHYPASGSSESDSTQVSDAVAGAEAGDVASSLKGGSHAASTPNTADRTSDTAPSEVKVDSAEAKKTDGKGSEAKGSDAKAAGAKSADAKGGAAKGSADDEVEQGHVIDPAIDPADNPADPEKRGNHRGDA
ncbi:hypothetical protein Bra3105_12515 [Brachybacterium halotolerans subsp. kimchii]|uniref:hypothetical protein n=1 Tax=Brachybacterium halotolerans TaxID=2795215 RepID=UPI001E3D1038|nr:hypothetical protein [Brachybacterium halotolerans]UEJ81662.1 hypothetical protein Bra3105_12515 [Brachybacterium halotolerans subsp. kimchii]